MTTSFNRWFVSYGFRIGLGSLILVAFLYYSQKQNFQASFLWVIHTSKVQQALVNLGQAIELSEKKEVITQRLSALHELITTNPRQIDRLKNIQSLLEAKTELKSEPSETKRRLMEDELNERILVILGEMREDEGKLLKDREKSSRKNIILIDFPIIIGGLFACFLIYMANRITQLDLEQLKRKDRELEEQSKVLRTSKENLEIQTKILSLTMESMADGLIVVNERRESMTFNSAARDLLGASAIQSKGDLRIVDFIGKDPNTSKIIPPDESPLSKAVKGEATSNVEILVESEGQRPKILSFNSRPLIDETGKTLGAISVFRDVTKSKELEESLRKAQKAALETTELKSLFLANMSHEIRTPLNGILGMAEIMSHTQLDEKQSNYLDLINHSCQNLLTIINDILDFSKIEAGKLEIEKADFNLPYVVDHTVRLLAPKAWEKSVTLMSYVCPRIPKLLRGDPGRMGQILLNLLGNAIKFTDHGRVSVWVEICRTTQNSTEIKFTVEDTGVGISQDRIQTLFQAFSQADASTSRRYGGTGLGLSISKQLVELMGGQISASSQEGKGSKFWFTIPFENPQTQVATESFTKPLLENVLLFDNDPLSSKILGEYIKSWNLQMKHLDHWRDFETLVQDKKGGLGDFDAVLVSPPSGVELDPAGLLSQIQHQNKLVKLTVILDNNHPQTIEKYRHLGVSHFLFRPVTQSELYNHLLKPGVLDSSPKSLHNENQDMESESSTETPRRILLAEDNTVNQLIAQTFLKELGYFVHTVANGKEVLAALRQSEFDLILMDCQMPEMDGFEASREIRAHISSQIPIIALTANAMKGDDEKCRNSGMDGYLPKPFRKEQLQSILKRFLPRTEKSFDPHQLDLFNGYKDDKGEDLRKVMIELYLQTTPPSLQELEKDWQANPENLKMTAHTLKSSTAAVGGVALSNLFEAVENGGASADRSELERIRREFEGLKKNLENYLKAIG